MYLFIACLKRSDQNLICLICLSIIQNKALETKCPI